METLGGVLILVIIAKSNTGLCQDLEFENFVWVVGWWVVVLGGGR